MAKSRGCEKGWWKYALDHDSPIFTSIPHEGYHAVVNVFTKEVLFERLGLIESLNKAELANKAAKSVLEKMF